MPTDPKSVSAHLMPVYSAPIAAHLLLAGHAVAVVRHDPARRRYVFYFEAAAAKTEYNRIMRALDMLRADAERGRQ